MAMIGSQNAVKRRHPRTATFIAGVVCTVAVLASVMAIIVSSTDLADRVFPPQPDVNRQASIYRAGASLYNAYYWVGRGKAPAAGYANGFDRALHIIKESLVPEAENAKLPGLRDDIPSIEEAIRKGDWEAAHNKLNRLNERWQTHLNARGGVGQ